MEPRQAGQDHVPSSIRQTVRTVRAALRGVRSLVREEHIAPEVRASRSFASGWSVQRTSYGSGQQAMVACNSTSRLALSTCASW
jgi:hypothetical protein